MTLPHHPLSHPRPLYRWKSFWLGLLVTVFLAWAWWDSTRHESIAWTGTFPEISGIYRHAGVTWFFLDAGDIFRDGTGIARRPRSTPPDELQIQWGAMGVRYLRLPDVAVLLTWLALWTAFLRWHGRRMKRIALGSAELERSGNGPDPIH